MPDVVRDTSPQERRSEGAEKRSGDNARGKSNGNEKGKDKARETGFSASCERFLFGSGPSYTDGFKHIDDDLFIDL